MLVSVKKALKATAATVWWEHMSRRLSVSISLLAALEFVQPSQLLYANKTWLTDRILGWAISTGAKRPEITSVDFLKGGKIGVSRIGSGSYVMGFVLADQHGWLTPGSQPYSDNVVLNNFENLRNAVNSGAADFFMWEHFTSKKYYDSGEIRRVGEIYTPWSSWKIVASTKLAGGADGSVDGRVKTLFEKLDLGVKHFHDNVDEAIKYISTELGYTEPDAREWLKTVRFPTATEGVKESVVKDCVSILRKAGVLVEGKGMGPEAMVVGQYKK